MSSENVNRNLVKLRNHRAEVKGRPRSSRLWNYFLPTNVDTVAVCSLCHAKFSFKSSITNLRRHLERKHKHISLPRKKSSGKECDTDEGDLEDTEEVEQEIEEEIDESNIAEYSNDGHDFDNSVKLVKQESNSYTFVHDGHENSRKRRKNEDISIQNVSSDDFDVSVVSQARRLLEPYSKAKHHSTHSLSKFFYSMCEMTQTLPANFQLEIKKKLFAAVSEAEELVINQHEIEEIDEKITIMDYRENCMIGNRNRCNSLDKFFSSMCEMTIAFPSHLQLMVKKKLFEAVTSAEENSLQISHNVDDQHHGEYEIIQFTVSDQRSPQLNSTTTTNEDNSSSDFHEGTVTIEC